jgi:hypothetical protein
MLSQVPKVKTHIRLLPHDWWELIVAVPLLVHSRMVLDKTVITQPSRHWV